MYNISTKYKHFLLLTIKLLIVIGACYFIYQKLASNQLLSLSELKQQLHSVFSNSIWTLVILLLFTDANWLLEIFKWKTLTSIEKKISFLDAYEQCLASLTTSIITPNRIGEYGAKALYFKKKRRKKIMLLNFIGNFSQLSITLLFGIVGMLFFIANYHFQIPNINLSKTIFLAVLLSFLLLFRKKIGLSQFITKYYEKILNYLKQIPLTIFKTTLLLSLARYLVFSHQFYFFLTIFGVEMDYISIMNLLFLMYFVASIIPSLAIFDWAIKGSIAIWIFNYSGVNHLTIVTITTFMWLLNFAIPALLGSIFVLNFKLKDTK